MLKENVMALQIALLAKIVMDANTVLIKAVLVVYALQSLKKQFHIQLLRVLQNRHPKQVLNILLNVRR